MKSILGKFAIALVTLATTSAFGDSGSAVGVWLAKPSGNTQCEGRIIKKNSLVKALEKLESAQAVAVEKAMTGTLKNMSQCQACNCPDGSYFVAFVKVDEGKSLDPDLLSEKNWEVVSRSEIVLEEDEGDYKVLPVVPTM